MGFKSRGPTDFAARFKDIVPQLYKADEDYGLRNGIEPYGTFEEALAPACTPEQIKELETFLGQALPPSYRAFLSVYGGWDGLPSCGGAPLLGPAQHQSEHVRNTLGWKSTMFDEFEPTNPIAAGAIPLAIGDDRNMYLLEPPVRDDGEMDIVKYYLTEEEGRYANLLELFERLLADYRSR